MVGDQQRPSQGTKRKRQVHFLQDKHLWGLDCGEDQKRQIGK